MVQKQDEWRFVRERAAQLYEEDEVQAALRLMRVINRMQQGLLEKELNMNKQQIVSTQSR